MNMQQEFVEPISQVEQSSAASTSIPTLAEERARARLEALKKQKFTPEGREERIAKALAVLNQPSTISLPEEAWKRIVEDPDLADQF